MVLAGPNGAGKSTVAPHLLREALEIDEFVNADMIAAGLSAFRPESVVVEAGRIMLTRMRELAGARASFAFETTLATRSYAPWLRSLRDEGYRVHLVFLSLPDADAAVARVAERVRGGGHDIPPEVIRRRFRAGIRNLFGLYIPVATSWRIYDNHSSGPPQLIAARSAAGEDVVFDRAAVSLLGAISMNVAATTTTRPYDPGDDQDREQRALARAVRQVLIRHKREGRPIVVWEDGQVRWIAADEIVIPDEPA